MAASSLKTRGGARYANARRNTTAPLNLRYAIGAEPPLRKRRNTTAPRNPCYAIGAESRIRLTAVRMAAASSASRSALQRTLGTEQEIASRTGLS